MGEHYAARAQRVDLLGHVRQKSGDQGHPHQKSALEARGRHAPPLLLGWLPAPLK